MTENEKPYVLDVAYTGMSLAYKNTDYIADKVLPRVSVEGEKFSYKKYPVDAFLNVPKTLIGSKGMPEKMDIKGEEIPEIVEYHALMGEIPETELATAKEDDDPIGDNILLLTESLTIAREARTAKMIMDATSYGKNVITLSGSDQLNDKGSSAIDTILSARRKMLIKPNMMVVNDDGATYLQTHPDFVSLFKADFSGSKGIVPLEFVAQCLKLKEILVGQSLMNDASKGQNPEIVSAWGNDIVLFYQNPLAKPKQGMTFGFTGEWGSREVSRFFDGRRGPRGVHENKVSESIKELICAPACGSIIKQAFATEI